MKIMAGKAYEGKSSIRLEDGEYELQIIDVSATKGRVNMTLATSNNQKVFKTFFLLNKDGKTTNERGMRELADFVTTAMQIEDEEVEVKVESSLGFYLKCDVRNSSYEKDDGTKKNVYNVNRPQRCNGFSDGVGSLLENDEEEAEEVEEVEEVEEEVEDTMETDESSSILSKYGLG